VQKREASWRSRVLERLARLGGVGPVEGLPSTGLAVKKSNTRLDAVFFQRLLSLLKPYWWRKEAWPAWLAYASSIGLGLLTGLISIWSTRIAGAELNAAVAKTEPSYWHLAYLGIGVSILFFAIGLLAESVMNFLNVHWTQWMTRRLLNIYLNQRTYYEIHLDQEIDNPDQRIQNEVEKVVSGLSKFPSQVIRPIFIAIAQIGVITSVSPNMLWASIAYALAETVVAFYMIRPQVAFRWKATMTAADFRHNLVSLRENAETVAFYRGEAAEERSLVQRLDRSVHAVRALLYFGIFDGFVSQIFKVIWTLMPYWLLAPLYFEGKIQLGDIVQAQMAAGAVVMSIGVIKGILPEFVAIVPSVVRLAEIQEKLQAIQRKNMDDDTPRIRYVVDDSMGFENVTVVTPDGSRTVVKDLTLDIPAHQPMLIVGQTGVGKSSLLRAMAGLWIRGGGRIRLPAPGDLMFLPQKPYMMLGTLRQQILYPHTSGIDLTDEQLQTYLEAVALPDLMARMGGSDAVRDWRQVLSLGEQQRLAFARVLVSRPHTVFLDESTSAVDVDTERRLYDLLASTVGNYVSVGHRPTLFEYHKHVLRLRHDGWSLDPAVNVAARPVQADFANQEI